MSWRRFSVACLVLLPLALTWFAVLGMNREAARYDRALAALDAFQKAEGSLRRDILSARADLLRNYDPLVQENSRLYETLNFLRQAEVEREVVEPLTAMVVRQEELTEAFKSNHALLQNSLSYFRLFTERLESPGHEARFIAAVSELGTAMLSLTLDRSEAAAQETEAKLNTLAMIVPPAGDANAVRALLAHGRLLCELLPATDTTVRTLYRLPRAEREEAVKVSILADQQKSRARASQYRLLLYATSVLLFALLVYFALQLRKRIYAQLRRAALEHIIAIISMRLIDVQGNELEHCIEHALQDLAGWVKAQRAYFAASGKDRLRYLWSETGCEFPAGWPEKALMLAQRLDANASGGIYVAQTSGLASPDRSLLLDAGVRGWLCIPTSTPSGSQTLLGFDVLNGEIGAPSDEIGLLRMASDAIANAVKRDLLDRERRRLEASLHHARRMETVGSLTSGIAHNFNNIIGAILGYTEMAEAQVVAPGSPIHAHLAAVRRSGERARDLVEQILTFGNRRDSAHRPMCIRRLIEESASLLSASLPSSVRIVVDATPDSVIVSGQFTQLQQVILNLGHNAAQAMDGAGNIELMAEVHDIAKNLVLSHGQLPVGRYVRIAVRDNGRGIDEKTLERIFEPFFTTRRSGNGLGLATARAIVSEHHGAINVTTAIGKGSLVEVWLPCTDTAERALGSRLPEFPRGAGETIMVIDDDPESLLSDEDVVAALGYEPVGFVQINDALVAYRAAPIRFDAILIGHVRMPVQALKLAATLHDAAPGLPIILAASTGDFDADRLAAAGVSELLRHPLSSTELAAALVRCLQTPRRPARSEQYSRVS